MTCPLCQGPMKLIAFIEDPGTAKKILDHLGFSTRAPPRGRGRFAGAVQEPLPVAVRSVVVDPEADPPYLDE